MPTFNSRLEARVASVNLANKTAMDILPVLRKTFAPLVGQKITKADGSLLKKIELPKLDVAPEIQLWRDPRTSKLCWHVKACHSYNGIAMYAETWAVVGYEEDGVLARLNDEPLQLRTDYTAAEILQKRAAVSEAEKALSKARGALAPFDMDDR